MQASSVPKGAGETPEDLNELFASLKDMGLDDRNEDELAGFLQNMMEQLVSKDVLYEPLKELSDNVRFKFNDGYLLLNQVCRVVSQIPRISTVTPHARS